MPMTCAITVWGALAGLSIAAVAGEFVVSNCDDIAAWNGGALETETVHEGSGAISWTPSQSLSLSTEQIPHDWSSGTGLSFWMHSAKATGTAYSGPRIQTRSERKKTAPESRRSGHLRLCRPLLV